LPLSLSQDFVLFQTPQTDLRPLKSKEFASTASPQRARHDLSENGQLTQNRRRIMAA